MEKTQLPGSAGQPPIDPLRRVFRPVEIAGAFRTIDGVAYQRQPDGSIRRAVPVLRGKAARKMAKRLRRQARGT